MVVNILLALLLSTGLVPNTTGNSAYELSRQQANYYITQMAEGQQESLHYWALSQLVQENDTLLSHIDRTFRKQGVSSDYIQSFFNTNDRTISLPEELNHYQQRIARAAHTTNSPLLLLDLLSSVDSLSLRKQLYSSFELDTTSSDSLTFFSELFKKLTNGKEITAEQLPTSSLSFVHFIILTRNQDQLVSDYFDQMMKEWEPYIEHNRANQTPSLQEAIKQATLIRIAHEARSMNSLVALHDVFAEDRLFPNSQFKLALYKYLDYGSYRQGYYEKPLNLQREKSIPLARYLKDRYSEYYFLKNQGIFLYQLGNIKKAQKKYQQVLDGIHQYDVPMGKIDILNNLGLTYYKTGYYDEYVDILSQALALAKEEDNYRYQLEIYRNLHIYHRKNKNWTTAQKYLGEARQLAEEHGNTQDLAAVFITTASYFRDHVSNYRETANYLEKAEQLVGPDNYYNQFVKVISEKAKLNIIQDNLFGARSLFNELKTITQEKSDTPNYLYSLIRLADIEIQLDNYEKARRLTQQIHEYDTGILDFEQLVKLQSIEAILQHHRGEITQAIKTIKPAIEHIIQRARNSSDLHTGYWHLEPEYTDVLKTGVDLYLSAGRQYDAVKLLDRIKTINDAELIKNPLIRSQEMSEKELSRKQRLDKQLNQLRKQYLNAEEEQKLTLTNKINRLKAQRNKLYGNISDFEEQDNFSVRAIQNKLPFTQLVLHVTELKDTFYITYISSNYIRVQQVQLNDDLRSFFNATIESYVKSKTDLDKLYTLYTLLRFHEIPEYIKNITLIPDSYLYRVPLGILPVEQPKHSYSYGSTTYLIEQRVINYLTSLKDFNNNYFRTRNHSYDFIGFGITNFENSTKGLIPLPYADQEVRNIHRELKGIENKKIFLNQEATEEEFKKYASQSRIIHLATHSTVNNREPLFSSIYLHNGKDSVTASDNREGRIFAYELFDMDLNNQLIMMNSCESGSGPYVQGSGVMGLSRSLKFAGGNSLILNLWSVNDKFAADFATRFYHFLDKGDSKAEAMRKAKLHFLQNSNANPHYWGPYMLVGDPSPVFTSGFSFFRLITFSGFTLFF